MINPAKYFKRLINLDATGSRATLYRLELYLFFRIFPSPFPLGFSLGGRFRFRHTVCWQKALVTPNKRRWEYSKSYLIPMFSAGMVETNDFL